MGGRTSQVGLVGQDPFFFPLMAEMTLKTQKSEVFCRIFLENILIYFQSFKPKLLTF